MEVSNQLHAPSALPPESVPSTKWTGRRAGPGLGLDALEKRKISCTCRESWFDSQAGTLCWNMLSRFLRKLPEFIWVYWISEEWKRVSWNFCGLNAQIPLDKRKKPCMSDTTVTNKHFQIRIFNVSSFFFSATVKDVWKNHGFRQAVTTFHTSMHRTTTFNDINNLQSLLWPHLEIKIQNCMGPLHHSLLRYVWEFTLFCVLERPVQWTQ